VFLLGFSIGPILFGPLSDRLRPQAGAAAGTGPVLAGVAGLRAGRKHRQPVALRLLQGVAAGAAALPAAIVRDVFTGHAALSRQSYVALVNAVAPLLAPLLGAGLLAFGSWRLIYGCLGVIGLVLLGLGASAEETRPPQASAQNVLRAAVSAYGQVLRDRHYLVHAGLLAASFGTMFAYITGSSAVFIDMLGVSSAGYGALFALTAAGTIGGAAAGARLATAGTRRGCWPALSSLPPCCARAAGRRPVRRPFGGGGGRLRPVGQCVCRHRHAASHPPRAGHSRPWAGSASACCARSRCWPAPAPAP
jgi:DHA1 family bicyclomycin/chloramphenicol resistance-like MFS transporter